MTFPPFFLFSWSVGGKTTCDNPIPFIIDIHMIESKKYYPHTIVYKQEKSQNKPNPQHKQNITKHTNKQNPKPNSLY